MLAVTLSFAVSTAGCSSDTPKSEDSSKKSGKKGKKGSKKGSKKASADKGDDDTDESAPSEGDAMDLGGSSIKKSMDSAGVEVALPSPGSMFVALRALGKPDWKGVVKPIKTVTFDSENRNAIIAGFLIADFFAQIQAKDKAQATALIDQLEESAKGLKIKIPGELTADLRSKVKGKKWKEVPGAVTALNTELRYQLLEEKKRPDLAQLIALGAYVEGAWIGTHIISNSYSKKTAVILQQDELIAEITTTKKLIKGDDYSDAIYNQMGGLKKLMKVKGDATVSEENVTKMHSIIDGIRGEILD